MSDPDGTKKAHCNECLGERNHRVLASHKEDWSEVIGTYEDIGDITIDGRRVYELLKCCGCDSVRVLYTSWFSEHTDHEGRWIPTKRYYPPAVNRKMPEWLENGLFAKDSHFVPRLLRQIYEASAADCFALAAMGIRALLEQTMIEKVADQGSFKKNLGAFESAGHVGANQRKTLEGTLELGHAAIHRNFDPSAQDISSALEITEGILASVYVHEDQAQTLKARIPPRT